MPECRCQILMPSDRKDNMQKIPNNVAQEVIQTTRQKFHTYCKREESTTYDRKAFCTYKKSGECKV